MIANNHISGDTMQDDNEFYGTKDANGQIVQLTPAQYAAYMEATIRYGKTGRPYTPGIDQAILSAILRTPDLPKRDSYTLPQSSGMTTILSGPDGDVIIPAANAAAKPPKEG